MPRPPKTKSSKISISIKNQIETYHRLLLHQPDLWVIEIVIFSRYCLHFAHHLITFKGKTFGSPVKYKNFSFCFNGTCELGFFLVPMVGLAELVRFLIWLKLGTSTRKVSRTPAKRQSCAQILFSLLYFSSQKNLCLTLYVMFIFFLQQQQQCRDSVVHIQCKHACNYRFFRLFDYIDFHSS